MQIYQKGAGSLETHHGSPTTGKASKRSTKIKTLSLSKNDPNNHMHRLLLTTMTVTIPRTKQIFSTSTKTSSKSNSAVTTKPIAAGTPEKMPAKQPPRRIPPNTSGTASNNIPSLSSGNNLTNQYRNDNQPPNGGPRRSDQNRRSEAPLNAGFPSTNNLSNQQISTGGNGGRQYFWDKVRDLDGTHNRKGSDWK